MHFPQLKAFSFNRLLTSLGEYNNLIITSSSLLWNKVSPGKSTIPYFLARKSTPTSLLLIPTYISNSLLKSISVINWSCWISFMDVSASALSQASPTLLGWRFWVLIFFPLSNYDMFNSIIIVQWVFLSIVKYSIIQLFSSLLWNQFLLNLFCSFNAVQPQLVQATWKDTVSRLDSMHIFLYFGHCRIWDRYVLGVITYKYSVTDKYCIWFGRSKIDWDSA